MRSVRAAQVSRNGLSLRARSHVRGVEIEPARPRRRRCVRIDRDELQVDALAEPQHHVVRAHERVLAARLRRDPEPRLEPGGALREVGAGDDQVVDFTAQRRHRRSVAPPCSAVPPLFSFSSGSRRRRRPHRAERPPPAARIRPFAALRRPDASPAETTACRPVHARACVPSACATRTVVLERPKVEAHGDIACNVALQVAKRLGRNPRELAQQLAAETAGAARRTRPDRRRSKSPGPGFINLRLAAAAKQAIARSVLHERESFGTAVRTPAST